MTQKARLLRLAEAAVEMEMNMEVEEGGRSPRNVDERRSYLHFFFVLINESLDWKVRGLEKVVFCHTIATCVARLAVFLSLFLLFYS